MVFGPGLETPRASFDATPARKAGTTQLSLKVCGSSHGSHPRAAGLQNRSALSLLTWKARLEGISWRS